MGLFRNRGKKSSKKAAAELLKDELLKDELLKEQPTRAKAIAEAARREVTAEERPNPDQPGWGWAIGQEIGKARDNRTSQE